jgi:O-antigen/teichoic acid export membrane protein
LEANELNSAGTPHAEQGQAKSRMVTKRVGGNFLWTLASVLPEKLVFFVVTIYLARTLGVETFGVFTANQMIVMGIWILGDFGIGYYGIREVARDKKAAGTVFRELLGLRVLTGSLIFGIALLIGILVPQDEVARETYNGCCFYLLFRAINCDWFFMGLEKYVYLSVGTVVSSLSFLLLIIITVHGEGDAFKAAFFWSLAQLFGAIALLLQVRRNGFSLWPTFSVGMLIKHVRESFFFMLTSGFAAILRLLPVVIVKAFGTRLELGLFTAPYRIILIFLKTGVLIQNSFYPVLADSFQQRRSDFMDVFARYRLLMIGFGIVVIGGSFLLTEQLVVLILGDDFVSTTLLFRILFVLVAFRFLRFVYEGTMTATGFQRSAVSVTASSILVLLVLIGLVPVGALDLRLTICMLCTETWIVTIMIVFAQKTFLHKKSP